MKKGPNGTKAGAGFKSAPVDLYFHLARSFLKNNSIPLHPENIFKAEVLFEVCHEESGQARISAVKLLLDWGGKLNKREKDQDAEGNLSPEAVLQAIFNNLKEMGITREQMEKWMS